MNVLFVHRQGPQSQVMIHCDRCHTTWSADPDIEDAVGNKVLDALDHGCRPDPPRSEREASSPYGISPQALRIARDGLVAPYSPGVIVGDTADEQRDNAYAAYERDESEPGAQSGHEQGMG